MSSDSDGPMQRSSAPPVKVGFKVFTLDGHSLGEVAEVHDDSFKINAPLKRDFWLSCAEVWSADVGGVHVNFGSDDVAGHKLPGPESAPSD